MSDAQFWQLIEESCARREDDPEGQADALEQVLVGLNSEELQDFDRRYREQLTRAYRWDLWGVGYLMQGGMGDDAFDYFCDWLIGQGERGFEQVLADPQDILVLAEPYDELENESLRYAVQKAHERTHGEELPMVGFDRPSEPVGQEWDEDDLDQLFPRVAAAVNAAE